MPACRSCSHPLPASVLLSSRRPCPSEMPSLLLTPQITQKPHRSTESAPQHSSVTLWLFCGSVVSSLQPVGFRGALRLKIMQDLFPVLMVQELHGQLDARAARAVALLDLKIPDFHVIRRKHLPNGRKLLIRHRSLH